MKALYIQRHDATVRLVLKQLQRYTTWGGTYTVLDACKATELESLGAAAKRVPRLMIPPDLASDEDLAKMRPDKAQHDTAQGSQAQPAKACAGCVGVL